VPALLVARHHPFGGESCSRDPSHRSLHRLKSSGAPAGHAVGDGADGFASPGADCVSALGNDFLPMRNGQLGPLVVLQVLRGTLAELRGTDSRLLAGVAHHS
jgi:hypothetical protein